MFPDKSSNQPSLLPPTTSLSPTAGPLSSQQALAVPATQFSGASAGGPPMDVVAQAKQLIAQYQHDPYRLSGALQQLKEAYISEHFHLTNNLGEN